MPGPDLASTRETFDICGIVRHSLAQSCSGKFVVIQSKNVCAHANTHRQTDTHAHTHRQTDTHAHTRAHKTTTTS